MKTFHLETRSLSSQAEHAETNRRIEEVRGIITRGVQKIFEKEGLSVPKRKPGQRFTIPVPPGL